MIYTFFLGCVDFIQLRYMLRLGIRPVSTVSFLIGHMTIKIHSLSFIPFKKKTLGEYWYVQVLTTKLLE